MVEHICERCHALVFQCAAQNYLEPGIAPEQAAGAKIRNEAAAVRACAVTIGTEIGVQRVASAERVLVGMFIRRIQGAIATLLRRKCGVAAELVDQQAADIALLARFFRKLPRDQRKHAAPAGQYGAVLHSSDLEAHRSRHHTGLSRLRPQTLTAIRAVRYKLTGRIALKQQIASSTQQLSLIHI